jgi:hypothetical protein
MTININPIAGKAALDTAPPQQLADLFRAIALGHFIRAMPTPLRGAIPSVAGVNPYVVASAYCITLPDDAKAHSLFRVYARAGTATVGYLTVDNPDSVAANTAPITKHVNITATGDIIFFGADAWTSVDVLYLPEKYDVVEVTLPVVTNAILLPATQGEALFILEAQALVGTTIGSKIVDPPGTAVATGHAALDLGKLNVEFAAADAVTSARVKYAVAASIDINAFLETTSNYF